MIRGNHRLATVLVVLLGPSCIQVQPAPDFERARELVKESTGQEQVFDPCAPALTEEELDAVLAGGLSLEEALRLALVNNRDLQAEFQEIGIAHADWVQSRLLSNPSLDFLLRFPTDGGLGMLEAIASMELLELWRIPVRSEAARESLEATVLRIARRAGERAATARKAYYAAVAAEELHQVARENVELVARSFQAVRDLHDAGAADAFDESLARGPVLAAELAEQVARAGAANARRDLARELSLERPVGELVLVDPLPELAAEAMDVEALVEQALRSRLDLRAIGTAIQALDAAVRLEERKAWGDAAGGVAMERPAGGGDPLVGPALGLTLPVFDQNQAQIARSRFELVQMRKRYEAARVFVAQDVRSNADRVMTAARNLAFYADELLPQAETSLALARESYLAGRTTLLGIVEVQRQVLEARRGHVTLRLEAAIAASELARSVGAPLGTDRP